MPYHIDHSTTSSPDPLNDSAIFPSPGKVRSSGVRRPLPVEGSSPRKQTFQLDVGNQLSPQKLLVTVEAEHPEVAFGRGAPHLKEPVLPARHEQAVVRQNVRTTTTTIPVKGLSDTEDDTIDLRPGTPKRGRGRPRKSIGTPVPSKSKATIVTPRATPGARRRTLGDLVDGDDSDDWDFEIGAGVEVGRGKGRSRSRSTRGGTRNKSTPAVKHNGSPERTTSRTTSKQGRGRRKTLTTEEFSIHEDEPNTLPSAEFSGDHVEADVNGLLALRDMNMLPTQSAFSTIRSTTTLGNEDPDILLAKFSPAKKTPAQTGWSSPSVVPAQKLSTDVRSFAMLKPTHTLQIPSLRQISNSKVTENCNVHRVGGSDDSCAGEDEAQDGIGELAEFDTILESEGFSMISVDSVPSLREHLSSPATMDQIQKRVAPTAINDTISQQDALVVEGPDDSFSSLTPDVHESITSGRKVLNPQVLKVISGSISIINDSFSTIPSEVLEAATPGKQVSYEKLLFVKPQTSKGDDDSFSSIPPAILAAATPAKHRLSLGISSGIPLSQKANDSASNASTLPSVTTGIRSQNGSGLLSPVETPSPVEEFARHEPEANQVHNESFSKESLSTVQAPEEVSVISSHMRSSPPFILPRRFTYTAHLRQQRALNPYITETPSIVFSSPSLPPLVQQPPHIRTQVITSQGTNQSRQSLSPIVRAGRVLQDIATTSPSRNRSENLGSPFKSPVAPHNSSETSQTKSDHDGANEKIQKPSKESKRDGSHIFGGFSDDTRRELRKSFMLGEELARSQEHPKQTINCIGVAQPEDPFSNDAKQLLSPSPEESGKYILGLPQKIIRSEMGTVRSDGAMSWQAENTIALHTSRPEYDNPAVDQGHQRQTTDSSFHEDTELLQQRRDTEWARERAAVSSQIKSASTSQVIVISSDNEEEDIWQVEARHSSSILEEKLQSAPPRQEPLEKPRRSKIPSPWRKNSKRLVYSDELAELSPLPRDDETERPPLPEAIVRPSQDLQVNGQKQLPAKHHPNNQELPDSSIVWHIPQKLNFAPRPRSSGNLDLSALLGSSPVKAPLIIQQQASKINGPITSLYPILDHSTGDTSSSPKNATADEAVDTTSASYTSTEESQAETEPSITDEESVIANEPSTTDTSVQYPSLPSANAPSPQKSCLRTPTSASPIKSVAFKSPTPPPPPLSSTEWSKEHWQLLDTIWREFRSLPADEYGNALVTPDDDSAEISAWLGKKVSVKGYSLVITKWHLDIVAKFARGVPGWEEGYRVKRLISLIVGEQLRKDGKA